MHIADRLEPYDLHRLAAEEHSARIRLRLQAVMLAIQGQTAPQIAMAVSSNRRSVQEWVRWYNVLGIEGLEDRPHTGRGTILPREREAELCRRLDGGAHRRRWRLHATRRGRAADSGAGVRRDLRSAKRL